jgi:hypothetical protein
MVGATPTLPAIGESQMIPLRVGQSFIPNPETENKNHFTPISGQGSAL